jgi:signal transduction histidine kinase
MPASEVRLQASLSEKFGGGRPYVVLTVRDTGPGIPPVRQAMLFGPD